MIPAAQTVAGNPRNGSISSAPTMWRTATHEYVIITALDWHPWIWQRSLPNGTWAGHDLVSTALGTMNDWDSHNTLALAVDAEGIIHIAGNMHQEGMRYIRSTAPNDISAWMNVAMPTWWSRTVTNLITNPTVQSATGWSTMTDFTSSVVSGAFQTVRGTTDTTARRGVARFGVSGATIPVTPGSTYTAYIQIVDKMAPSAPAARATPPTPTSTVRITIEWRNNGSYLANPPFTSEIPVKDKRAWAYWFSATAPAGANNAVVRYEVRAKSGQGPTPGDTCTFDRAMFVEGTKDAYDYSDPTESPGGTAILPAGWDWAGAPHQSTSSGTAKMSDTTGADVSTYQRFERFSDGTILWSHDQSDSQSPTGRDWMLLRKPPGATTWQPCIGQGEIMTTAGGFTQWTDDVPDRSYLLALHVDRDDILHALIVWRRNTSLPGSMDIPIYVRSRDKGTTWEDVAGDAITAPFTPALIADVVASGEHDASPRFVTVDGHHHAITVVGNMAVDDHGHIHFTASMVTDPSTLSLSDAVALPASRSAYHVWWDGSAWQRAGFATGEGFDDLPTLSFHRGDLWFWGYRAQAKGLTGRNQTRWDPGVYLRLGACAKGAETAVLPKVAFVSGATYAPVPVHAGGLGPDGRVITRLSLPNGDQPRVVTYGDGVLRRAQP